MERLAWRDFRALLDGLRRLYALQGLDAFAGRAVEILPGMIPSEHTSYVEINPGRRRVSRVSKPAGPGFPGADELFEQLMHENPVLAYQHRTGDGRAARISDFLTQRAFRRTRLYNEFHRRLRGEYQIIVGLPSAPPLQVGLGFNRGRPDFSERERRLLNLLRPHLIQAYRNAEAVDRLGLEMALIRRGLEAADGGIVALGRDGRVWVQTPLATRWLAEYFPGPRRFARGLPESLLAWARQQDSLLARPEDAPAPRRPLVVERDERRLVVRVFPEETHLLFLLEERAAAPRSDALETLGLTRREAEVLAWVAQGKTNADIGRLLGITARTVTKHVEHIFEKLGVETRTAAAARALTIHPGESAQRGPA